MGVKIIKVTKRNTITRFFFELKFNAIIVHFGI